MMFRFLSSPQEVIHTRYSEAVEFDTRAARTQ